MAFSLRKGSTIFPTLGTDIANEHTRDGHYPCHALWIEFGTARWTPRALTAQIIGSK